MSLRRRDMPETFPNRDEHISTPWLAQLAASTGITMLKRASKEEPIDCQLGARDFSELYTYSD